MVTFFVSKRNISAEPPLQNLCDLLERIPTGMIDPHSEEATELKRALVKAWGNIKGSSLENTFPEKVVRAERLCWERPILTFALERHGNSVNGSTRAFLHFWEVDLNKSVARIVRYSQRQLIPVSKRMDCTAIARGIFHKICEGEASSDLEWKDNSVLINLEKVIPVTVKQTTMHRRRRFRSALQPLMESAGWRFDPIGNRLRYTRAV